MGFDVRRLSRLTRDGTTSSLEQHRGQLRKLYDVRPTPSDDTDEDESIVDLILDLEEWLSQIAADARSHPDIFTHMNGDEVAEFFAAVDGSDDQVSNSPQDQIDFSLLLRPLSPVPLLTTLPQIVATPITTSFSFYGGSFQNNPWSQNFFPQFQARAPEVINTAPAFGQPQVPAKWTRGRQRRYPLPLMSLAPLPDICPLSDVQIKPEIWAKALIEIFFHDDGTINSASLVNAAKVLFKSFFSKEEVKKCTFSGRNGGTKLDPKRIKAIKIAVSWMKANKRKGVNPYAFTPTAPELTPEEVRLIEKHVFIGRRHEMNKARLIAKAVRRRSATFSNFDERSSSTSSRQIRRRNATVTGSCPFPIEDEIQGIIDILGDDDENPGATYQTPQKGQAF